MVCSHHLHFDPDDRGRCSCLLDLEDGSTVLSHKSSFTSNHSFGVSNTTLRHPNENNDSAADCITKSIVSTRYVNGGVGDAYGCARRVSIALGAGGAAGGGGGGASLLSGSAPSCWACATVSDGDSRFPSSSLVPSIVAMLSTHGPASASMLLVSHYALLNLFRPAALEGGCGVVVGGLARSRHPGSPEIQTASAAMPCSFFRLGVRPFGCTVPFQQAGTGRHHELRRRRAR